MNLDRLFMILLVIAGSALPAVVYAGGTVAGIVVDGMTGQPVPGVTLTVEGTDVMFTTNVGGGFQNAAPAGTYAVVVSKPGYQTTEVTGVVVAEGGTADFAVVLMPAADGGPPPAEAEPSLPAPEVGQQVPQVADTEVTTEDETEAEPAAEESEQLVAEATPAAEAQPEEGGATSAFAEAITVTASADRSTEVALLAERKGAAEISDSIGSQEMGKITGSDAAGVLEKVTGISIQDDKYVFVRGLGERYSNTSLNGSRIPTTEYDKKVVPLDLFPAKLLKRVKVSKSYKPDRPGDFAAGLVELETLDFPSSQTIEVGFGVSSNSETTGDDFGQYAGGLEFWGDGGQGLPGIIPDERVVRSNPYVEGGFTPEELEEFGEAFVGRWTADDPEDAPLNQNYSVTYGNTFGDLGLVVSGTRAHKYKHRDEVQQYFTLGAQSALTLKNDYDDFSTDTETVRTGFVGNLAWEANANNTFEVRLLNTRDAKAETRFFAGYNDDAARDIRNYRVRYEKEDISTIQLSGEHFLEAVGKSGALVEWRASSSSAVKDENLRESLYDLRENGYELEGESQSAFLLFNELEDTIDEGAVDWTQFVNASSMYGSVKAGLAMSDRQREFGSRRFRFNFKDVNGLDLTLMPEELLTPENINPSVFEIKEETRATDTYNAEHQIAGAYLMADMSFGEGDWRMVGGVRVEDSQIEVTTFDPFIPDADPIISELDDTDFMPSLSVIYKLNADTNLRASASQTVNRPEFRELAPFEFTDVVGGRAAVGNPELESATIRSLDLRWEWFPAATDVVAASLFFKDFDQPIERVLEFAVELRSTWRNVESARNYGFELEYRRNLAFLGEAFAPFTVKGNYTYVDSEVDLGDDPILTSDVRPLVGQPDHVLNLVLEWQSADWGSLARVLYNFTGERVYEAGGLGLPDVIQDSRSTMDFLFKQDLSSWLEGLSLKFSATNLLDEEVIFDGGRFQTYKTGRGFSLSMSYTDF